MFITMPIRQPTDRFNRVRLRQRSLYPVLFFHLATINGAASFVQRFLRVKGRARPKNLLSCANNSRFVAEFSLECSEGLSMT